PRRDRHELRSRARRLCRAADRPGTGPRRRRPCPRDLPGASAMRRRQFVGGLAAALAAGGPLAGPTAAAHANTDTCGCGGRAEPGPLLDPLGREAFRRVGSRARITGMQVFGVSLTPESDRPYVFVKLET